MKPTSQRNGPHTWYAKVYYRGGNVETIVQLQVQATIRQDVSVSPSVLAWNGAGEFRHEVTVTDVRTPPFSVTAVYFTSPLVKAEVVSSNKGVTRIVLQSIGAMPPGRKDEMLSIYTSDAAYAQLQLPVTLVGQVKKTVAVTPEKFEVRIANGGAGQRRPPPAVDRRCAEDRGGDGRQPGPDVYLVAGPVRCATVRIQVDASKLAGQEWNGIVRIQVSQPTEETIVIPIQVVR